ncbi:MAG: alginate lyase family protein [Fidelibacterota bacterium]|nr:MAG: alginate lyase family protein [Candidatus Neomarinimicrobiota bacterium]
MKHFYVHIMSKRALPFLFLTSLLGLVDQSLAGNGVEPRLFLLDSRTLFETKERVYSGDKELLPAIQKLRSEADQALDSGPFSVMDKPFTPPSGNKHDYMSLAPYWWPNPDTEDGLPYIRKDGLVNPERNRYDKIPLRELELNVVTLALAYFYTEHEPYAAHAVNLIHCWFLDEETRMNPHLEYGQGIPGITEGRGSGIIDTRSFFRIAEVVDLLSGSRSWTEKNQKQLQEWFSKYLDWMLNSEKGKKEAASNKNHGTWFDVIASHLAFFVGEEDIAQEILKAVPECRIAVQIEPDGRQPLELKRTRSFHYSAMNIEGLFHLAIMGENVGLELWNFETEDGRCFKTALTFLLPYVTEGRPWPYQQVRGWEAGDSEILHFILRLAVKKYGEPEYEAMIKRLPDIDVNSSRLNLLYPLR